MRLGNYMLQGQKITRSEITRTEYYTAHWNYTDIPFADPPVIPMTNVVIARPVKSNPEELSFAGVNLTFLLVIIVLSILCLNILIIGITVIICRWIIFAVNYYLVLIGTFYIKRLKKRKEPVYIPSQPCSSRRGECSSEGSILRSARDLTRDSELGSEGAETLIKKQDLDETFVWDKVEK